MNNIQLDTDLLSLLPPWYRQILDYQEICQTEETQLEALAQEINAVADNFFFQTMDVSAISQWESILGIVATPSETISFRQARLINRISTKPPFTLGFLYQKLDELIGPDQWKVTVDYPNYTLYIQSSAQDQSYATEVAYTIGKIKPAHIVYINTPFLESVLTLSETISQSNRQWNYNLGTWQLGVLPFSTDIDKGVIKMPSTPSIQTTLLNDVATFTSSDIAQAQLNGSLTISDLSKSVSGNTVTISYTVQPSQLSEITQVALQNSSGKNLTAANVYILVTDTVILKHSIPVQEGA